MNGTIARVADAARKLAERVDGFSDLEAHVSELRAALARYDDMEIYAEHHGEARALEAFAEPR